VSLRKHLGRGHLQDRDFARLWTNGGGDPHLEGCAECRARFDAFDRWLVGVGEELRDQADEVLTAERLGAQQAHIARRLEALERPARVIVFPKAARAVISGHSHVRRWVTVGVAAGLIAGIGLGQVVNRRTVREQADVVQRHFSTTDASDRARVLTPVSAAYTDDDFLMDAEAMGPRAVKELGALDALTPHARDLVQPRK
jgi:hypothetical protein